MIIPSTFAIRSSKHWDEHERVNDLWIVSIRGIELYRVPGHSEAIAFAKVIPGATIYKRTEKTAHDE